MGFEPVAGTGFKFSYLTQEQVEEVHAATCRVLETTGLEILNEEALDLLRGTEAEIDGSRVRLSTAMVNQALQDAPSTIEMYNRAGEPAMTLAGENCYYGTGSDCIYTIDPYTTDRRLTRAEDIGRIACLVDGLPHMDFTMSMGVPSDKPLLTGFVHQFENMVLNTGKPILITTHDAADVADIRDIGIAIRGSDQELREKPFFVVYSEPASPLIHNREGTGKLLYCAEHGVPCIYIPTPMMGATSPITLAGTLVQANAETLSGVVLAQLKQKGAPVIMGSDASAMDMRTSIFAYGAPELQALDCAFGDLARYYDIPLFCIAGASDSKLMDEQAAVEATFSILLSTLNGCNLIHDLGYVESGSTSNPFLVTLCDEIVSMTLYVLGAMDTSAEAMRLEVIDQVGPRGEFVTTEDTLMNFRNTLWFSRLMDRTRYSEWHDTGSKDLRTRLQERTREILETHEPPALEADLRAAIEAVASRRDQ